MAPIESHEVESGRRALTIRSIVAIYWVAGATWIVASDVTVSTRASVTMADTAWNIAKGLLFITATAILLVPLLRRRQRALDAERLRSDELAATLAETARMDAVGRLAGGVAHDFNNLLTVIRGSAELARSEVTTMLDDTVHGPDPTGAAAPMASADHLLVPLDTIIEASDRAERLTGELQTVARRNRMDLEHVDLGQVVDRGRVVIANMFPDTVRLEVRCPDVPVMVGLDTARFHEVLLNLAGNARDAMPEGGTFTLAIERETTDARLSAIDTGRGMTDDEVEHCFEPFFTTKPVGVGNGLGLSLAYGVVRQSGGTIRVESIPGKGTRFDIRLPLVAGADVEGSVS